MFRLSHFTPLLGGLSVLLVTGCSSVMSSGHNAQGVRLFQQQRYREALQQFEEAKYADAANPDSYYNLAATYERLAASENRPADLRQAEEHYHQCLDHAERAGSPNQGECYRSLTVLLARQGRHEEARRLLQGWVDRQPQAADAKIELARFEDEVGNKAVAKARLLDALQNDPRNTRALTALAKIREDMGEHSEALATYQRSLSIDRLQPAVASRISALQPGAATPTSAVLPGPVAPTAAAPTAADAMRTVNGPAPAIR